MNVSDIVEVIKSPARRKKQVREKGRKSSTVNGAAEPLPTNNNLLEMSSRKVLRARRYLNKTAVEPLGELPLSIADESNNVLAHDSFLMHNNSSNLTGDEVAAGGKSPGKGRARHSKARGKKSIFTNASPPATESRRSTFDVDQRDSLLQSIKKAQRSKQKVSFQVSPIVTPIRFKKEPIRKFSTPVNKNFVPVNETPSPPNRRSRTNKKSDENAATPKQKSPLKKSLGGKEKKRNTYEIDPDDSFINAVLNTPLKSDTKGLTNTSAKVIGSSLLNGVLKSSIKKGRDNRKASTKKTSKTPHIGRPTLDNSLPTSQAVSRTHAKITAKPAPNYTQIHQKAQERLESLTDMLDRKAERARLLLSGAKVKIGLDAKPKTNKVSSSLAAPPKRALDFSEASGAMRSNSRIPKIVKQAAVTEVNVWKVRRSNSFVLPSSKNASQKNEKKTAQKREENKNAIKTKSVASSHSSVSSRRELIKGVRSNRRFELLMGMRNGTR